MSLPGFVAIAWGNAGFRAWLMSPDGDLLDSVESPDGLSAVRDRNFAGPLRANCGSWLTASPGVPVLLSGMVARETRWYLKHDPKLEASKAQIEDFMIDRPGWAEWKAGDVVGSSRNRGAHEA